MQSLILCVMLLVFFGTSHMCATRRGYLRGVSTLQYGGRLEGDAAAWCYSYTNAAREKCPQYPHNIRLYNSIVKIRWIRLWYMHFSTQEHIILGGIWALIGYNAHKISGKGGYW